MHEEPLAERIQQAVDLLHGLPARKRVHVIADADVDGTAAAAILARALHRVGRRFTIVLTRRRDERLIELVQERSPAFLITADLGANLAPRLMRLRLPTIVLDHHEPEGDGDGDHFIHVNPHLVGEDGSTGASGAAVGFGFARRLLEEHGKDPRDLLPLALLGAWGDRYHGADPQIGLHARLDQEARGDPGIPWRPWKTDARPQTPLKDALQQNLDPLLPRLARDPGETRSILDRLQLDPEAPVEGLDDDARSRLASWTAASLLEEDADPRLLGRMLSPHPCFHDAYGPITGLSIPEVALRVDAGTRLGHESTALAALLGHGEAWTRLEEGLAEYRETVLHPLAKATQSAVTLGPAHLVRVEHGWAAGPVADRLMAWTRLGKAPVVTLGLTGRGLKLSLRARAGTPWRLDQIAAASARSAGGVGGGHRLAAGAMVPQEKEAAVLEQIQSAFKKEAARSDLQNAPVAP